MTGRISLTAGRDYRSTSRYEYVLQRCTNAESDDWEILKREGGFKSKATAVTAGRRAYAALIGNPP